MNNHKHIQLTILILLISLLAACGGGGDEHAPPPPAENSNWDGLVWDQDKWG
jgi:hypothetical protein